MIAPTPDLAPFRIDIPETDLADLKRRIAETRWIGDFGNGDGQYGMPADGLRDLAAYWADGYDWRRCEADINAHPQYRVVIDNVPIHFLWIRARRPAAALMLTHGWPWTFWDYRDLVPLLADPASGPAFDLVIPSLPGFGFSTPLRTTGINPTTTADLWAKLMTLLGYPRFGSVGGDAGAQVTASLNHAHADRLIGGYQSFAFIPGLDPWTLKPEDYDGAGEEDWHARWTGRVQSTQAHVAVNTAAPQTVGYALNDSPVGLLAWIAERRRLWSDPADVEQAFTMDRLLDGVSIWWFTRTVGSAGRWAAETARRPFAPRHGGKVMQAPTAFGIFPQDLLLVPRSVAERHTNLVRWTVMPTGGHFAPMEQPALLAADVQAFFADLLEEATDPRL